MLSTYNSKLLATEELVDDGRYAMILRRQSLGEMVTGGQAATLWGTV